MSVDWHEQHRMLKLAFPGNVKEARATYEIPYGYIERATNGEEEPGQQWIDVSGKTTNVEGEEIEYGLSLLNDSKYGFDVKDAEMRMSVLRSPIYAFHIPAQKEPGKFYHYIDQGFQIVNYSLVPHPESWQKAKVVKRARALNNPLISILEPHHGGTLPLSKSFLEVKPDNIMVSVVKKAEDSNDLIVRCYETDGEETSAEISIPSMPQSWRGKLKPSEIKTLKFSAKGVEETDLLEGA
jgi:alpha-mannosidase